jgi:hypothetical protein
MIFALVPGSLDLVTACFSNPQFAGKIVKPFSSGSIFFLAGGSGAGQTKILKNRFKGEYTCAIIH